MTAQLKTSFLTEVLGSEVCPVEPPVNAGYEFQPMSVLHEDELEEAASVPVNNGNKVPSETGSEYDTDLEDSPSDKTEYDSSGLGFYKKICEDMKMRPASSFMRQARNVNMSLKYQSLGCRKTAAVTHALTSNTFVETLDLSANDISCDGVRSIAYMLTENYFITELNLEDNRIGLSGITSLCNVLSDNSYIKNLNLAGNSLKDESALVISEMLKRNYTLFRLCLKHNQITCSGAKSLSEALLNNESLADLDISWNKIRGKGSEMFGNTMCSNSGLNSLNISYNGLDARGADAFLRAIRSNQQLVNLNIGSTRFPGTHCKELGNALALNSSLKILRLGNNPLKEEDIDMLFSGLTTSLYIIGLEDITMSKGLYQRLQAFEKEHGVVVHYGNSRGNQSTRPMTASSLKLDEFITTNHGKLMPLVLAKDTEKSGFLTVSQFQDCLRDAGLRLRQTALSELVDKISLEDGKVPYKEIMGGKIPFVLQRLRAQTPANVVAPE